VNCFGCQWLNSAFASAQYRTNETTAPLKPSNPRACLTFAGWAMPYHKTVTAARYFKIQIPAEIFLTGFFVSLYALFAQFADNPLRHIVSETARIDEILFGSAMLKAVLSNVTTVLISEFMMPKAILTRRKSQVLVNALIGNVKSAENDLIA
jgi:hypothetical protein